MRKLLIVSTTFTALLASQLWADEGRIPIYRPTTITQAGHYVVTRDFAIPSGDGVVVQANNVTLDLNGHTLSGGRYPVYIVEATEVTVKNGRIVGGNIGVVYSAPSGLRARVRVEDVELVSQTNQGISMSPVEHVEIVSCRIIGPEGVGMVIQGLTGPVGGQVVGNRVHNPGAGGIHIFRAVGMEIRGNVITNPSLALAGYAGLLLGGGDVPNQLGGNLIIGNTVRGEARTIQSSGIVIQTNYANNLILNNVVTGTSATGIGVLSDGNRLAGNVCGGNAFDGFDIIGDRNLVEQNEAHGNTLCGIRFSSTAPNGAFRDNMLRGNAGGAVCGPATSAGGNIGFDL